MTKKETRYYETILVIDALLEDDEIDSKINKYISFLNKNGCEIEKVDRWGRKKLAYQIKRRYSGYYVSIEFRGKTSVIEKLERQYQLDENILRHLTLTYDNKTLEKRRLQAEKSLLQVEENKAVLEEGVKDRGEADDIESEEEAIKEQE